MTSDTRYRIVQKIYDVNVLREKDMHDIESFKKYDVLHTSSTCRQHFVLSLSRTKIMTSEGNGNSI